MKIAVVPSQTGSTIYLHEDRKGVEWIAQIAMSAEDSAAERSAARTELREFLERALATIDAQESGKIEESGSRKNWLRAGLSEILHLKPLISRLTG